MYVVCWVKVLFASVCLHHFCETCFILRLFNESAFLLLSSFSFSCYIHKYMYLKTHMDCMLKCTIVNCGISCAITLYTRLVLLISTRPCLFLNYISLLLFLPRTAICYLYLLTVPSNAFTRNNFDKPIVH